MFNCGIAIVQGFLQYFVADRMPLKGYESTTLVSLIFIPIVLGAVIFSMLCGYLSDRWNGRRKIFVYVSGFLQAACSISLMFITSFPVGMLVAFLYGAGFGTFTSVDLAMAVDVLDSGGMGRDLGIWYVTSVLPQLMMTPLAGLMLDYVRDGWGVAAGYGSIFLLAALFMFVGTALVEKIKGVE